MELLHLGWVRVRNGAEFRLPLSPIDPVKALSRPSSRCGVRFPRRPDKYAEQMSVARVHERGNRAAFHNILAATLQYKTLFREIADRNREFYSAVEPSPYGVLVVGGDAGCVAGLQRAHMYLDNFPREFGLIIFVAKAEADPPSDECDEKESSGCSQPVPKEGLRNGRRGCHGTTLG